LGCHPLNWKSLAAAAISAITPIKAPATSNMVCAVIGLDGSVTIRSKYGTDAAR
jgi:hypothetical protein